MTDFPDYVKKKGKHCIEQEYEVVIPFLNDIHHCLATNTVCGGTSMYVNEIEILLSCRSCKIMIINPTRSLYWMKIDQKTVTKIFIHVCI